MTIIESSNLSILLDEPDADEHEVDEHGTDERGGKLRSRFRSLKWQIISIAFVSVLGLAWFVLQVIVDANKEATLLKEIEEQSYPIQANMLAAVHKLEFIHRELENAVTTGDEETAINTDTLAIEFRNNLIAVGKLDSNPQIPELLEAFDQYHNQSRELALALIIPQSNIQSLLEKGQKNSRAYFSLLTRLNEVHRNSNEKFAAEIADATHRASQSVRFAVMGGMLVIIMVVAIAVFTANSINRRITGMVDKLKTIALEDGNLKVRLDLTGADEMTELADWFNKIIAKLEDTSRKAENDILRIANTDELSGLRNRRYLMTWLDERVREKRANDNFAVVFLDLDEFKPINDKYGHEVGDGLIVQVAIRLCEFVSINYESQPANSHWDETVACRLGGDEFMLILPVVDTDWDRLSIQIKELCAQICTPYNVDGVDCEVGVSIGVSCYPDDGVEAGVLLDRADKAMYEAKRKGKRQFTFYEESLSQNQTFQNKLAQALTSPELTNEMRLVFQPKVSLSDDSYIGAEVLLRWDHPELGNVYPEVFIPIAESKKLITKIDTWVLDQVCRQIRLWYSAGGDPGIVSVNISAQTLLQPKFIDSVAEVLQVYELDPNVLQLEITETAILDLNDGLFDTIDGLRKQGVSIAMDDFGAGHSSLKLLIDNQIDLVKLDKSLIDDITTSKRHQQIVKSVIALAHSLNVSTLAEGIERSDQLDYLRSIHCNEGQGYYFSKPLSAQVYWERYVQQEIKKVSGF